MTQQHMSASGMLDFKDLVTVITGAGTGLGRVYVLPSLVPATPPCRLCEG